MTAVIEVAANQVQQIELECIDASLNNPRRTMDEAALKELAASIREIGITNPLLVRPRRSVFVRFKDGSSEEMGPASLAECSELLLREDAVETEVDDRYEIVAGHRRAEAATLAALTEVPCIVRDLTDAEAALTALTDNLQRVDVPAMEEAEYLGKMLERLGSIAAVAAKVGKEQAYIAKRLRLLDLTSASQSALREQLITIDHALLLARLASDEQNEALKWCLDTNAGSKTPVEKVIASRVDLQKKSHDPESTMHGYLWEPESVAQLKQHIEEDSGEKLARAPWDLDRDVLIPEVETCNLCPKNTRANAPLFGDLAIGEPTCTDGRCYKAKTIAWVQIKQREAGHDEKAKKRVPRLSWKETSVKPATCFNDISATGAMTSTADPTKVLKAGQWVEAKKNSCPNVRPGVTVDWSDVNNRGYMHGENKLRKPGETIQVCIAVGCKVHKKEWEKPRPASNQPERLSPEQEKRQELTRRCVEKTEGEIRAKVFKAILDKLDAAKAVHLVADSIWRAPELRKSLLAMYPKIAGDQLEAFVLFANQFHNLTSANGYVLVQGTEERSNKFVAKDREKLWKLAKSLGVDADVVTTEYFHTRGDGIGGIAPAEDRLLPKGYKPPARKDHAQGAKPAKKKAILDSATRKRIADAQKKRWAAAKKGARG